MYIRACVWDSSEGPWLCIFSKHPGISRLECHQTVAFVADRPTATACGRNWMLCAFAGCLRTPRGGWKKRCRWLVIWAFRCRRLGRHHFNTQNDCNSCWKAILCWRISASRRNAGKTVRSMPWKVKRPTGRFVFAWIFMVQSAGIAFRWKKRVTYRGQETLGQPHGTMPKPLIRLLRSFGRRALYGRRRSPYGRPGTRGRLEGGWKRTLDPRRIFLVTKKINLWMNWLFRFGGLLSLFQQNGGLVFFWGWVFVRVPQHAIEVNCSSVWHVNCSTYSTYSTYIQVKLGISVLSLGDVPKNDQSGSWPASQLRRIHSWQYDLKKSSKLLLMEDILHQLRLVVSLVIYDGFYTFQVGGFLNHQGRSNWKITSRQHWLTLLCFEVVLLHCFNRLVTYMVSTARCFPMFLTSNSSRGCNMPKKSHDCTLRKTGSN